MKKIFVYALLISFVLNFLAVENTFALMVKGGILSSSEVWSGEVEITDDVIVPKNSILYIKPGTVLKYKEKDKNKTPDFIVNGTLKMGEAVLENSSYQIVPISASRDCVIQITPYEVDTKSLRDEFNAFRIQYAVIWTLLGGGLIYSVSHR